MTLQEFFHENPKIALAFSGGVDSAYLLYTALRENADVCAYYVRSVFQPQFELDDAEKLADSLHAKMKVISLDVLCMEKIESNPPDRCYYCKKAIFTAIQREAERDGYPVLIDGTNLSDDLSERPGIRALLELSVRSPLRECGLTKDEIRRLSREVGLFTWNKPAYACLATRIPYGTPITNESLVKTEKAEEYLAGLGFSDFRVRMSGTSAKLQIRDEQFKLLADKHKEILAVLKKYYNGVVVDLETRDE